MLPVAMKLTALVPAVHRCHREATSNQRDSHLHGLLCLIMVLAGFSGLIIILWPCRVSTLPAALHDNTYAQPFPQDLSTSDIVLCRDFASSFYRRVGLCRR